MLGLYRINYWHISLILNPAILLLKQWELRYNYVTFFLFVALYEFNYRYLAHSGFSFFSCSSSDHTSAINSGCTLIAPTCILGVKTDNFLFFFRFSISFMNYLLRHTSHWRTPFLTIYHPVIITQVLWLSLNWALLWQTWLCLWLHGRMLYQICSPSLHQIQTHTQF